MEKIDADYIAAFKAHQTPKVNLLRMVKSAIKNTEIEVRRHALTDEEILAVLVKEAKRRKESIAMFTEAGRTDLVAAEQAELDELEAYLPAQMSDADLEQIVQATVTAMNGTAKNFGQIMGAVMAKVKGQADGNRVSTAVKKILS